MVADQASEVEAARGGGVYADKLKPATLKKYLKATIEVFAYETNLREVDLGLDVQLAQLVGMLDDDEDRDLKDAVLSGRLRLTKDILADLVAKKTGVEAELRELLAEQV